MMNCPNCKAAGSLRVVRAGGFVECVTPNCHWTQSPLDELVCDAAVATWHRANPTRVIDDPEPYYSLGTDETKPGRPLMIVRVSRSGQMSVDSRRWDRKDRGAAQAALDEFEAKKACE